MNPIEKLTELFKEFPGIGPRQARRFVYFLLRKNDSFAKEIAKLIPELKNTVSTCEECQRYYPLSNNNIKSCAVCFDTGRNSSTLMVVSRDTDMDSIEKTGEFDGYYFILGGIIPVLEEKNAEKYIRINKLKERIAKLAEDGLNEIIIAMNANPDGDNTAEYLKTQLDPLCKKLGIAVSVLGKGLSTGTELEYSDKVTISHALKNRIEKA